MFELGIQRRIEYRFKNPIYGRIEYFSSQSSPIPGEVVLIDGLNNGIEGWVIHHVQFEITNTGSEQILTDGFAQNLMRFFDTLDMNGNHLLPYFFETGTLKLSLSGGVAAALKFIVCAQGITSGKA